MPPRTARAEHAVGSSARLIPRIRRSAGRAKPQGSTAPRSAGGSASNTDPAHRVRAPRCAATRRTRRAAVAFGAPRSWHHATPLPACAAISATHARSRRGLAPPRGSSAASAVGSALIRADDAVVVRRLREIGQRPAQRLASRSSRTRCGRPARQLAQAPLLLVEVRGRPGAADHQRTCSPRDPTTRPPASFTASSNTGVQRRGRACAAPARARRSRRRRRPHEERLAVGQRPHLEGRLDDHAQRAERAGEELRQIVAGDVLHHPAAAAHERAVGGDDAHADQPVAHLAVAEAQRAAAIGGDQAADGHLAAARRIERQPLAGRRRARAPARRASRRPRR